MTTGMSHLARRIGGLCAVLVAVQLPCALGWAQSATSSPGAQTSSEPSPESSSAGEHEDDSDDPSGEKELFEVREDRSQTTSAEGVRVRQVRRVDEKPLEQMSREEADESGFVFGDDVRTSAIFLAATAGLFAHGVGHWYTGERRTAAILLAAEAASVGLMTSALLWQWLSDGSPASRVYAGPAMYAGLGLFGLSYLLDVIGTMQDSELGLPNNSRRTRGISIEAHYNYINLEGYPSATLQLLTAGSRLDLGWGYAEGRTDQDVFLDTSVYGLTLGARPWRGPGQHNFVFVEAGGEFFQFGGTGAFTSVGAQARAGVSVGLGNWISQLRHVAVGAAIGYGRRYYALPTPGQSALKFGLTTSYIPFEMFTHLNLTDELNARLAYERHDGDFLQSSQPIWGVASLEFLYQSTEMLDLVVRGEAGGGLGVTGGLRLWFWP